MERYRLFTGLSLLILIAMSCTTEKFDVTTSDDAKNTSGAIVCDGILNVVVNGYDGVTAGGVSTRGAGSWEEGDKIFLLLTSGSNSITAEAQYSNSKWTVNLTKTPVENTESNCVAYYFEGAGYAAGTTMNLSERSAVYEELNGKYLFDGSAINITASLKPKYGRVRFAGTKNDIINVFGMTYPTKYDASNGTFSYGTGYVKDTVEASGFTPYIYGYMKDENDSRLYVVTKKSAFTKYCDERVFKAGESGWLTVPTTESHFGWFEYLALKVNGYELKMMPVWYATATKPYLFLLSETEVTEGLYNAAIGTGSKTIMKPKTSMKYEAVKKFVEYTIGGMTGLPFGLATKEEWLYAFGANTYSGSEIIDEVAWHSGNSDDMIHDVKQLNSNEYGLYDMSGNVSEWTLSYYELYNRFPACGGCYSQESSKCTKQYEDLNDYSEFSYVGIRLYAKF